MVGAGTDSWNLRNRHITDTLHRLIAHHGHDAKGIVWAHNTHVGDARATDTQRRGRHNIGQLVDRVDPTDRPELRSDLVAVIEESFDDRMNAVEIEYLRTTGRVTN